MGRKGEKRKGPNQGFTLMEVVVALAILGIGLTVLMELFSGGLRLGRMTEEQVRALQYASLKLEEVATQKTMEEGEEEGEFDKTYRWKLGIRKMDLLPYEKETDYKPPAELYHVRISVLWMSGVRERSTSLETYRTFKPGADEKKS